MTTPTGCAECTCLCRKCTALECCGKAKNPVVVPPGCCPPGQQCAAEHMNPVQFADVTNPITGAREMLHVMVPVNNYAMFRRRYQLFAKFKKQIETCPAVVLYIVEVALGDRPFMCTEAGNPRHLQLRTEHQLWVKENMINLMAQRLPPDWKYCAWVDADINFSNHNWAVDTIHALQTKKIVQPWQTVVNYGPSGEHISNYKSFCYQFSLGRNYTVDRLKQYEFWHPGFAWACTRQAFNELGGLYDMAILGAGDHHMATALIGQVVMSAPNAKLHPDFIMTLQEYEQRCTDCIRHSIGFVKGTIHHDFHGSFKNRRYVERWEILQRGGPAGPNGFNPLRDIKRDWQGLWQLDVDHPKLRDAIHGYFRVRDEDNTTV